MFQKPTAVDDFGTINGIRYQHYRGRFVRTLMDRQYDVPYEIVTPERDQVGLPPRLPGTGCVWFEVPHFDAGLPLRSVVLEMVPGSSHAAVGYSHFGNRSLDPTMVLGREMPPLPPGIPLEFFGYWEQYTDRYILIDGARALRKEPLGLAFDKVYGIGSSDAANSLNWILATWDDNLFDLSFPLIATSRLQADQRSERQGKVMALNAEWDFEPVDGDPAAPRNYRFYDFAGCPHIPSVPGTTPLTWVFYLRALLLAGHEWVTRGVEPPPSQHLKLITDPMTARDPIARDEMGNALGGVRHPALETQEAHFIARGPAGFLGAYDRVRSIGDPDFYPSFKEYAADFQTAVKKLVRQRLLLEQDVPEFTKWLQEGKTFTQAYAEASPRREEPLSEAVSTPPVPPSYDGVSAEGATAH